VKCRVVIAPSVAESIKAFSPSLKKKIRKALEAIGEDPHIGKPLRDELKGLWSFRVSRYRIIYRIHRSRIEVQVIDVGPRNIIYERIVEAIKRTND